MFSTCKVFKLANVQNTGCILTQDIQRSSGTKNTCHHKIIDCARKVICAVGDTDQRAEFDHLKLSSFTTVQQWNISSSEKVFSSVLIQRFYVFYMLSAPGFFPPGCPPTPPPCGVTVARSTSPWATAMLSDWLQRKTPWSSASDRCWNRVASPGGAILGILRVIVQECFSRCLLEKNMLTLCSTFRYWTKRQLWQKRLKLTAFCHQRETDWFHTDEDKKDLRAKQLFYVIF